MSLSHWALPANFTDFRFFGKVTFTSTAHLCSVEQQGNNGSVIRVDYPLGSTSPSKLPQGGCQFYAAPAVKLCGAKQFSFEYEVYFPRSFAFGISGKLPGMTGGGQGCGGGNQAQECWSSRMAWRSEVSATLRRSPVLHYHPPRHHVGTSPHRPSDGKCHRSPKPQASRTAQHTKTKPDKVTHHRASLNTQPAIYKKAIGELYMYLPQNKQNSTICNVSPYSYCNPLYGISMGRGAFSYALDHWTTVRQTITISSQPLLQDGAISIDINGNPVISYDQIAYPVSADSILFSSFFGGNGDEYASPQNQSAFFRSFSINVTQWGDQRFVNTYCPSSSSSIRSDPGSPRNLVLLVTAACLVSICAILGP